MQNDRNGDNSKGPVVIDIIFIRLFYMLIDRISSDIEKRIENFDMIRPDTNRCPRQSRLFLNGPIF